MIRSSAQFPQSERGVPPRKASHRFDAGDMMMWEGDWPVSLFFIQDGWAARTKNLPDGRRALTGLYLPGDLCDPAFLCGAQACHPVEALTQLCAVALPIRAFHGRLEADPKLARAMFAEVANRISMQEEWLFNLGRKTAIERISHLFCELTVRLERVGRVAHESFDLPLTQSQIADCMGLTPIHVNRVLQDMRAQRLIELHDRRLRIENFERLAQTAHFNPAYLGVSDIGAAAYGFDERRPARRAEKCGTLATLL